MMSMIESCHHFLFHILQYHQPLKISNMHHKLLIVQLRMSLYSFNNVEPLLLGA